MFFLYTFTYATIDYTYLSWIYGDGRPFFLFWTNWSGFLTMIYYLLHMVENYILQK